MRKHCILIALILIVFCSQAQFVDNYGIRGGIGLYNTELDGKLSSSQNEFPFSFSILINAEKNINKKLIFRTELGYIHNKFSHNNYIVPAIGDPTYYDRVIHLILLNQDIVFTLSDKKISPYIVSGLSENYRFSTYAFGSEIAEINHPFSIHGHLGVGIELKEFI